MVGILILFVVGFLGYLNIRFGLRAIKHKKIVWFIQFPSTVTPLFGMDHIIKGKKAVFLGACFLMTGALLWLFLIKLFI